VRAPANMDQHCFASLNDEENIILTSLQRLL
jgi:hypothetical protein